MVLTVGTESGRVASPACTATSASGVTVIRARISATICGRRARDVEPITLCAMPSKSALVSPARASAIVGGALLPVHFGVGLRL